MCCFSIDKSKMNQKQQLFVFLFLMFYRLPYYACISTLGIHSSDIINHHHSIGFYLFFSFFVFRFSLIHNIFFLFIFIFVFTSFSARPTQQAYHKICCYFMELCGIITKCMELQQWNSCPENFVIVTSTLTNTD